MLKNKEQDLACFQFKLTEKFWVHDGDENQVFRALELSDGRYLISWTNDDGFNAEYFYTMQEVMQEFAEEAWEIIEK